MRHSMSLFWCFLGCNDKNVALQKPLSELSAGTAADSVSLGRPYKEERNSITAEQGQFSR